MAAGAELDVVGLILHQQIAFCRSLPDTTCGQLDGKDFFHLEPRHVNAGHLFWVDLQPSSK